MDGSPGATRLLVVVVYPSPSPPSSAPRAGRLRVPERLAAIAALGVLLATSRAQAASLQAVKDWGSSGVPSTASMYIYVPDQLAAKPPILVLAHFCSGSASAVFGQAQTGGLVKAADQYGFILVVPQTSKNCWDVGSTKSLTHDGGGDTQAVAQMVKYAISKYGANAERVYATGDSSGGMMTQALLAVYPDVFKAGSAFAGVPAGCWAAGNPDGSWSNQCAGGQVMHTPKEWADLVAGMDPSYSGHRPRVQLFHGDADDTIKYQNHLEAIKEWTQVLGVSTDPTSTDTVTLGSHQAKRQQWKNACGYVVLDAFTSQGGDHGPSDALFNASFVVPFLGLDKTDAVDPELATCGAGGTGGAAGGGAGGLGGGASPGGMGSGGTTSGGSAGSSASMGGSTVGMAGQVGAGGAPPAGGAGAASGSAPIAGGVGPIGSGGSFSAPASSAQAPTDDTAGCACSLARSPSALEHALAWLLLVAAAQARRLRSSRAHR
jgi:acetylxylan esterase